MSESHNREQMQVNWQKFALLATALAGMFALVVTNTVQWGDVAAPVV